VKPANDCQRDDVPAARALDIVVDGVPRLAAVLPLGARVGRQLEQRHELPAVPEHPEEVHEAVVGVVVDVELPGWLREQHGAAAAEDLDVDVVVGEEREDRSASCCLPPNHGNGLRALLFFTRSRPAR
jgi:hypothetical protein